MSKSIFYYIKQNTMHLRNSGNNFVCSQYCSSGGNMNEVRKILCLKNSHPQRPCQNCWRMWFCGSNTVRSVSTSLECRWRTDSQSWDKKIKSLTTCNAFDPIYFIIYFLFIYLRPYSYTVTLDCQYAENHVHNEVNL